MANPLKPGVTLDLKAMFSPIKMTPEIRSIAEQTFLKVQAEKAELIKAGKLDPQGNPLGTVYNTNGTPKRTRTPEPVGPDGRRRRKTRIAAGQIFGDLTILRKGPKIKAARKNLEERWRCRCSCGRELIVPKYYLVRKPNPKTHCGCKTATIKSLNEREYRIWIMIHQRIYNPKHNSYEHYKAKGITLFPGWHKDKPDGFKKFFEHVGKSPGPGYSLDRIHNNRGYEPNNLRWATATEQRANQGDKIGGYTSEEIADMGYTEDEFIDMILRGEIQ